MECSKRNELNFKGQRECKSHLTISTCIRVNFNSSIFVLTDELTCSRKGSEEKMLDKISVEES